MIEQLQKLLKESKKASEEIRKCRNQIRLISHYDADGIASAAIMVKALLRAGKSFHLTNVKQLNDKILEDLQKENRDIIIFTDLGSGYINDIKKYLGNSLVIICDHHQPEGEPDDRIIHINSVVFGIDENISGAGISYLLARTLDPKNIDLAHIAIIGAIGDSQIDSIGPEWGLNGLNKEIVKEAENKNKIKVSKGMRIWGRYSRPIHKALEYSVDPYIPGISGSESGAIQFLQAIKIPVKKTDGTWRTISDLSKEEQMKLAEEIIKERIRNDHENPDHVFGDVYDLVENQDEFRDANEFATILNACGKMGRTDLGILLCLGQDSAFGEARSILEKYRREIGRAVTWIYDQIEKKTDRVRFLNGIYIQAGSSINEHIMSNALSIVHHSGMLPSKPIFGFADSEEGVKISARQSQELAEKHPLSDIVNKISSSLGGQGGGHTAAAGATIPKGKEEEFIRDAESMINFKKDSSNKDDSNLINQEENRGNEKPAETERGREGKEVQVRGDQGRQGSGKEMEGKGLVQYLPT